MQCSKLVCGVLVSLCAVLGCNTLGRQPVIRHAAIEPTELKPGDVAVITVEIGDRHGIVDRVEGVVQEDPAIKFKLRDDGVDPDKKAGDGIWSLKVDVPFQAPPGEFTLEFTAFRADGQPIIVRDAAGAAVPLMTTFGLAIRYPATQEEAQP